MNGFCLFCEMRKTTWQKHSLKCLFMANKLSPYLQSVQQDYTTLLSNLIRTFPEHPEFSDLVQLTDYNDPEMDFFENMKHIQVIIMYCCIFSNRYDLSEWKTSRSNVGMFISLDPQESQGIAEISQTYHRRKYDALFQISPELYYAICHQHYIWWKNAQGRLPWIPLP